MIKFLRELKEVIREAIMILDAWWHWVVKGD